MKRNWGLLCRPERSRTTLCTNLIMVKASSSTDVPHRIRQIIRRHGSGPLILKKMSELVAAGVIFDELDMGAIKTINHIATVPGIGRSAWFKDPDGNTLALFQSE